MHVDMETIEHCCCCKAVQNYGKYRSYSKRKTILSYDLAIPFEVIYPYSQQHYLKQQRGCYLNPHQKTNRADEMAHWGKAPAIRADNLSLIPRTTSTWQERTDPQSCPLPSTCSCSCIHTQMK